VWLKVEIEKKRKKEAIVKERILSFGIQRKKVYCHFWLSSSLIKSATLLKIVTFY
jgi:hypothetical protein